MQNGQEDYPLVATNMYAARATRPTIPSTAAWRDKLFGDGQGVAGWWQGAGVGPGVVYSELDNAGRLPDGRPGTLIGVQFRIIEDNFGATPVATPMSSDAQLLRAARLEVRVAETTVVNAHVSGFPPSARLRTDGWSDGAGAADTVGDIQYAGAPIPFEPHPILENETISAYLYGEGYVTAKQVDYEVLLVVTDVRAHKKILRSAHGL